MKRGAVNQTQSKATPGSTNGPTTQKTVKTSQNNLNQRINNLHNSRPQTAKPGLNKQVSFLNNEEGDNSDQPLALTTKNLDLFNKMVLKTIRTAKFDER